jgi:hypothetical protein
MKTFGRVPVGGVRLRRGISASVELVLRDARLTDIDRIVGLMERTDSSWSSERLSEAADVLRQMVYLPNATLVVALEGRMLVGFAVLALRTSVVAGGLVGTVDLVCAEPGRELDGVLEGLLRELMRSARNKGCVVLEANPPEGTAELPTWEALGFAEDGLRWRCQLVGAATASAR